MSGRGGGGAGGVFLVTSSSRKQSLGSFFFFVALRPFVRPASLGLFLRVPLLLQPLGVTLRRGVDDGDDKVADHDQHQLLKEPRQPVVVLRTRWTTPRKTF